MIGVGHGLGSCDIKVVLVISCIDIPGSATLIFDVELFEVKDGPETSNQEQENVFKVMDTDGDKQITPDEVR